MRAGPSGGGAVGFRAALCIAMPAYDEAGAIEGVVRESLGVLDEWPGGGEVLVVDDGSTDGTAAILARLAAADARVRVVTHERNLGLAAALERMRREVRGDFAFLTASDGEWSSRVVLEMVPAVRGGADIVVGRRRVKTGYSPYRRIVSASYNALPRVLFGVPTYDAGGQRLVRTELLRVVPRTCRSVYADAELLIRAQRLGYRVAVVDVPFVPRTSGTAKGAAPRLVVAAALDMLRLFLRNPRLGTERVGQPGGN